MIHSSPQAVSSDAPYGAKTLVRDLQKAVAGRLASSRIHQDTSLMGNIFPAGRISELAGAAATSAMARLIVETQVQGEPVVWVTGAASSVHPPDLQRAGVCLETLTFIRLPKASPLQDAANRLRAAELAMRSGAFGLVLIEAPQQALPVRALSRLHAMARRHDIRVVFRRSHSQEPQAQERQESLGPLVALRVVAHRDLKHHTLNFEIQKNKIGLQSPGPLNLRLPDGVQPALAAYIPEPPVHLRHALRPVGQPLPTSLPTSFSTRHTHQQGELFPETQQANEGADNLSKAEDFLNVG